jgi:hypothetical protein
LTSSETTAAFEEGRGVLCFLDEPVFAAEIWRDEGKFVVHPVELDLVAAGATVQEATSKVGQLILDLAQFLHDQGTNRTAAEEATMRLILERVGPPLVKYHLRARRVRLLRLIQRMLGAQIDWRLGRASTHARSDEPLTV